MQNQPRKLMDLVSDAIRVKHYSYRTEQTYKDWIKRFILFHEKRHPKDMGVEQIQTFVTVRKTSGTTSPQIGFPRLFHPHQGNRTHSR